MIRFIAFGQRIEKISPGTTSIFVYEGGDLVETTNASAGEVASYAQGDNVDEPLAMDRSGAVDCYELDGLGSVTSLSNSNGAVAQTYTYDSFGNQVASSGSLTNFFRYTGREFDSETEVYFDRARYYDPSSGRFLSEDPLAFDGDGTNFYDYVLNDPNVLWTLSACGTALEAPIAILLPSLRGAGSLPAMCNGAAQKASAITAKAARLAQTARGPFVPQGKKVCATKATAREPPKRWRYDGNGKIKKRRARILGGLMCDEGVEE